MTNNVGLTFSVTDTISRFTISIERDQLELVTLNIILVKSKIRKYLKSKEIWLIKVLPSVLWALFIFQHCFGKLLQFGYSVLFKGSKRIGISRSFTSWIKVAKRNYEVTLVKVSGERSCQICCYTALLNNSDQNKFLFYLQVGMKVC